MTLQLKPGTSWWETYGRCTQAAPEAFDSDRLRNLTRGEWRRIGIPGDHVNAVDGTPIPGPPLVDHDEAVAAVEFACGEHDIWAKVDLDERRARVSAAVDALSEHHDLLALLLVWEIGKPWRLACCRRRPLHRRGPLVPGSDRAPAPDSRWSRSGNPSRGPSRTSPAGIIR